MNFRKIDIDRLPNHKVLRWAEGEEPSERALRAARAFSEIFDNEVGAVFLGESSVGLFLKSENKDDEEAIAYVRKNIHYMQCEAGFPPNFSTMEYEDFGLVSMPGDLFGVVLKEAIQKEDDGRISLGSFVEKRYELMEDCEENKIYGFLE